MGWLCETAQAAGIVKSFVYSVTNTIPRNDVLPQKQVGYKQSSLLHVLGVGSSPEAAIIICHDDMVALYLTYCYGTSRHLCESVKLK